jgi:hypothetical protein
LLGPAPVEVIQDVYGALLQRLAKASDLSQYDGGAAVGDGVDQGTRHLFELCQVSLSIPPESQVVFPRLTLRSGFN